MIEALLLAALLHRPPRLVSTVYAMGGLDAVAVVEMESQFRETAFCIEPEGTSWGLFQLYDKYHPQFRDDLLLHIVEGVRFLAECKTGRTFHGAVAVYNGGKHPGAKAREWGRKVEAKRNSLAMYLWRHLR